MTADAIRRRTLRVLVAAQVLGGLGQSAAAAGALLAVDMTGSEAMAGLPLAFLVIGAAATAVPISALSRRVGRAPPSPPPRSAPPASSPAARWTASR